MKKTVSTSVNASNSQTTNETIVANKNSIPGNLRSFFENMLLRNKDGHFASSHGKLLTGIQFLLHEAGIKFEFSKRPAVNFTNGKYSIISFDCTTRNEHFILFILSSSQNHLYAVVIDQNNDDKLICNDVFDIVSVLQRYR